MKQLRFTLPGGKEICPIVHTVLLGGYTGRNSAAVALHVAEMKRLGVEAPQQTPTFYRALTCLLTLDEHIEVLGNSTRPEAEFVLFCWADTLFVTVGNDQFDLTVELGGAPATAKNLCQKALGLSAWPVSSVMAHWDRLEVSLVSKGVCFQHGPLETILPPEDLISSALGRSAMRNGEMIFSGTIPFLAPLPNDAQDFVVQLKDPVMDREIVRPFTLTVLSSDS